MPNAKLCLPYNCWQYLFVLYAFISVSEAFFLMKTTLDSDEYYIAILKNRKKDFRKELMRELEEEKRKFFLTSIASTEVYMEEETTIKYRDVTDLDSENSRVNNTSHIIGTITKRNDDEQHIPDTTNVNNSTPKSDKEGKPTTSKTDKVVENGTLTTDTHVKNHSTVINKEEQVYSKVTVEKKITSPDKHLSIYTTLNKKEIEKSTTKIDENTKSYHKKGDIDEKKNIARTSNYSVATDIKIKIYKSTVNEKEKHDGPTTEKETINYISATDTDKDHEMISTTDKKSYNYFTGVRVNKYTTELRELTKFTSNTDNKILNFTLNNNKEANKYTSASHKKTENDYTNANKEEKTNSVKTSSVRRVTDVQKTTPVITETTKFISIAGRTIQNVTLNPVIYSTSYVHKETKNCNLVVDYKITTCYCKPLSTKIITSHQPTKTVRPKIKKKHRHCHTNKPKRVTFKKTTEGFNPTKKALGFYAQNKMHLETKIFFSPTKVIKYKEIPNKIIKLKTRPVLTTDCNNTFCHCQHNKKELVTEKSTQKLFRQVQGTKMTPRVVFNSNCTHCKNVLIQTEEDNLTKGKELFKESSNRILHNNLTTTSLSLTAKNKSKPLTTNTKKQSTRGQNGASNKSDLDSKDNLIEKNAIRMHTRQPPGSSTTSQVGLYASDDYIYDYYEDDDEDYTATTALSNEVDFLRDRLDHELPLQGMGSITFSPNMKKESDYFRKRLKPSTLFIHPVSRRKIIFEDVTLPTNLEYVGQKIYNLAKGLRDELGKTESDLRKIMEKELFAKEWLGNLHRIRKRCERYEKGLNRARKHHIQKLWELLNLTKIELHVEERINGRLNKILKEVKKKI